MKLAYFDDFRLGVIFQNQVFDVTDELSDVSRRGPEDLPWFAIVVSPR